MRCMDRLFGRKEKEGALLTPDDVESWSDAVNRLYAESEPLPSFEPLPPLTGHGGPCPKCGSHATTIEYKLGQHVGCPDGRFENLSDLVFAFGLPKPETQVAVMRASERVPEHHDRRCANCKHAWVEAVLAKESQP